MNTEATIKTITPDHAIELLSKNIYQHQRAMRSEHVRYLAQEMRRRTFKQDTAIELTHVNADTYVTDGRHRLSAIVASGVPQRFVVIERCQADEEQVALDYIRTDKGLRRSLLDDYSVLGLDQEIGLSRTNINYIGGAVSFIHETLTPHQSGKMPSGQRLSEIKAYGPYAEMYAEVIAGHTADIRKPLWRSATLSVALITLRFSASSYGTDVVTLFWRGVATDDGLTVGDPRKTAYRHVQSFKMVGGKGSTTPRGGSQYSARYLAHCFNAYVEGRSLLYPRPDASQPISILGSFLVK